MDMEGELLFGRLAGIGVFAHLVLPARCEILFIAAGKLQDKYIYIIYIRELNPLNRGYQGDALSPLTK